MGIEGPFWRAIAVYRLASLAYAIVLLIRNDGYAHPVTSWTIVGVMALWTAVSAFAYPAENLRRAPLLGLDVLTAAGCLLASPYAQGDLRGAEGVMPVPATWVAGPVLAWAVYGARRLGALGAAVVSAADLWVRARTPDAPLLLNGVVLLFLAGVVVGHVARLAKQAERRMQRAVEMEAAQRERDRLARGIHDSVLQVLALVQRRGGELGGEAAELGRLAGEQEAALRELISARPAPSGSSDLRTLLLRYGSARVTVSTPATPMVLPTRYATEVAAAVGAALDNVRAHCGDDCRAWVLAEPGEDGAILVSVRDEGPGIADGRLAQAAAEGRFGVSESIVGRIGELGGTVEIFSDADGTEIELLVPRPAGSRAAKGASQGAEGSG
ncbi:MacS family sensor histidine kinase [Nonomuraea longicatena]|uniref:DUF5931 domain-containing protein n=1 Tax=Nonomuraea longicatena TaxID=83682 RepID=A0ABN1PSU9_9ACTN